MVVASPALVALPSSAPVARAEPLRGPAHAVAVARTAHRVVNGLDLSKLGSLEDYAAALTLDGRPSIAYRVHSPVDWETLTGSTVVSIDQGGSQYERVPHISGSTLVYRWQRTGPAASYAAVGYASYARGFAALTKVAGSRLVRGRTCRQAGLAGRLWSFAASAPGAVYPHVSACVADSSGALLTYVDLPLERFAVTSVGRTGVIAVP